MNSGCYRHWQARGEAGADGLMQTAANDCFHSLSLTGQAKKSSTIMKYKRSQRVSELLKREISHIIFSNIKDPAVKPVTVTFVKVTDDLKHANIYYRVLGDESVKAGALKGLERAKSYIRFEIGQRTELRFVPEIEFFYDTGIDEAERIELLLHRIKETDVE